MLQYQHLVPTNEGSTLTAQTSPAWAPDWIYPFILEVGQYQSKQHFASNPDNEPYNLIITNPAMQPDLPYFVGYPARVDGVTGNFLFISADVPEQLRPAWLEHEIFCLNIDHFADPRGCKDAVVHEISFVEPQDFQLYKQLRLRLFEDLLPFLQDHLVPRATMARDYLRSIQ